MMDSGDGDASNKTFTKKELYKIILQCNYKQIDKKIEYLEDYIFEISKCERSVLKHKLSHFKSEFIQKWTTAHRKRDAFEAKNGLWLQGTITVPMVTSSLPETSDDNSRSTRGRPSKCFAESSERSKRRKTMEIRKQLAASELTYATQMSLRASGNVVASNILKDITKSPTRAVKFRRSMTQAESHKNKKLSPTEALSVFVEGDFTRRQYNIISTADKARFSCYTEIQKAKKQCYPKIERVTSTCAEVKLQDLLDHTCSRLCLYLTEVFETCNPEDLDDLELISKWGCDGSQQSQFKQKFENITFSDANIFQSSLVPVRLVNNKSPEKKVIWQNPLPSSPRFCRPIRIRFIHETKDVTLEEIQYIKNQIKDLTKSKVIVNETEYQIKNTLLFTMVDGKICNAATNTLSTMRCYLCGATSKAFNDLTVKKNVNFESLNFGLSVLHAKIRLFETILHLAYKIPIGKWQVRSHEDKNIVAETKKRIQQKFKDVMGLLIDIPKAGFGNTNDGNSARRFFADTKLSSELTGVDETLIYRLKVILEAISSGHEIDVAKFESFAFQTAQLYVRLYNWHPMTPTMHKILVHGAEIISHALLPIGQLSEEAAEARNKHFRSYRLSFARKFSREDCNKDVINRLLLSSDPYLSCIRKLPRKKTQPFCRETIELLRPRPVEFGVPGDESGNILDEENSENDEYSDSD